MSSLGGKFGRRHFFAGAALVGLAGPNALPLGAAADALDIGSESADWRRVLANEYAFAGRSFVARSLQDTLEVWESQDGGYMIVEGSGRIVLESSRAALSPFGFQYGTLEYLGPGQYFARQGGEAINAFTGDRLSAATSRARALDASQYFREAAFQPTIDSARLAQSGLGRGGPGQTAGRLSVRNLPRVKSGDVRSRVTSYSYITGSRVYDNNSGICGWVAGSIVTRYWHARSTARILLPSSFRSGTNMTLSPNFATHLQGSGGDSTWAPNVQSRLVWNAQNQKAKHVSSWALGNAGMFAEVRNNYPVILFGNLPLDDKKKGGHAVVAYGETNGGFLITHYGWAGYTDVVLNSGLAGSNARFRLV